MKKITSCILLAAMAISAVSRSSSETEITSSEVTASSSGITAVTDAAETVPSETEPEPWFEFQPKVTTSFAYDVYGQEKIEVWNRLVDAVMAGEDTFVCASKADYLWVVGEFPDRYFPVLYEIIKSPDDYLAFEYEGDNAPILYKVPKEEAQQMIAEFEDKVESIINENIRPEYSDFEKALALYRYFAHTYTYDYDTFAKIENEEPVSYTSAYRLLSTDNGICSEISKAYSYLLIQLGVDATTISNGRHEWSLIKLGDNYYHVDPTFVLEDWDNLIWFLMTDDKRCDEGGYNFDGFEYVGLFSPEFPPVYPATDDTYSELWGYHLESFDPETKTMRVRVDDDSGNPQYQEIDYSSYE
ncbi:MAG: transglutaminase domain-containing protein [Clostridiales bacterium]|nr:transglutaminase domain-containing protein [Clostridiales bacterium]